MLFSLSKCMLALTSLMHQLGKSKCFILFKNLKFLQMSLNRLVLQAINMGLWKCNLATCANWDISTSQNMWPNPIKPGTSRKTCFWVNSHNRWLAPNYFQIFKFVFSCLLSGEQCILSNAWRNLFKWDFFQTINDGLSLSIPILS